ncbi:MAG: hypothetical protein J1D77_03495 [Muribaculaceae bacterium]|nr:hypothetical protein [Muribaculaceae bacterium]
MILLGLYFVIGLSFLFLLPPLYGWIRKGLNNPKIGKENFDLKFLRRKNYIGFKDKVFQFSHFANSGETFDFLLPPNYYNLSIGGELAFEKDFGLGYFYYHNSILKDCKFIIGKYGVKWAESKEWLGKAEQAFKKLYL